MKLIPLTQNQFAQIDDEDYDNISKYKWCAAWSKNANSFYAIRNEYENGKRSRTIRMHRQIMNVTNPNIEVDHKDHCGINNQKQNLRVCSASQNSCNKRKETNCTSKFKGVSWYKNSKKWVVHIRINKKLRSLGYFKDEIQAAMVYNEAAKKAFGEFACLNEIP